MCHKTLLALALERCESCGWRIRLTVSAHDAVQIDVGGANGANLHIHVGPAGLHLFPPDWRHLRKRDLRAFLLFAQTSWTADWGKPEGMIDPTG